MEIQQRLFKMQDTSFREFHAKLCPMLRKDTIIGVKTPALRSLAREIRQVGKDCAFLHSLPHQYYEENQLHAFLISEKKDFGECLEELERFLPFVDNWATCDSLRPRCFRENRKQLLPCVAQWLSSEKTYTVRFGIEMLMLHFLEDDFRTEYLDWVSGIRSSEYYVNMMIAWYFATALALQYDAVLPYLTGNRLDPWIQNKTIQKARESFRVTQEKKEYLNSLKRR